MELAVNATAVDITKGITCEAKLAKEITHSQDRGNC